MMKLAVLILPILVLVGFDFLNSKSSEQHLVVQPESTIVISGKSNVKKFQCAISQYRGSDTLVLAREEGKTAVFRKGCVKLDATNFDCGMKVITKDFRNTIKAEQFPFISIDFVSFERAPLYQTKEDNFRGQLKISLTDVTRPFDVVCTCQKDERGFIHLQGSHDFTFSEFNMKAPTKMFGAVKVNDNITVGFHLVLLLL
jgi:hypothetical protein